MSNKQNRKILVVLAVFLCLLMTPFSFTYWFTGLAGGSALVPNLGINIGDWDEEIDDEDIIDRLPENLPPYIVDRIEDVFENGGLTYDQKQILMDGVLDVVSGLPDYIYHSDKVIIGGDIGGIFDPDNEIPSSGIPNDSVLVFLDFDEDGNPHVVVLHVTGGNITTPEALREAMNNTNPWHNNWATIISTFWQQGKYYTLRHAPVESNGRFFVRINPGNSHSAPPANDWHEISTDYTWLNNNAPHPTGYLVYHQNAFWISTAAWAGAPGGWGWDRVSPATSRGVFNEGDVVYTGTRQAPRFWRSLVNSNTTEPCELEAESGNWQEISNGWMGDSEQNWQMINRSHYFDHNTYSTGQIVIFGINAKREYRYYRARQNVPSGEKPTEFVDGLAIPQLNSEYWVEV